MPRTRIKLCGLKTVDHALAAAAAGADAIGLVFCTTSLRHLEVSRAREIVDALPPWVTPVGLFVNESETHIRGIAREVGLSIIQLHGDETPEFAESLSPLRVLKAVHVSEDVVTQLGRWRNSRLQGILLETHSPVAGGSGVVNDWDAIAHLQARGRFEGLPPIILAGGLTPENVGEVVRRLRPYAVDVSSGIELSKGVKSVEKMHAFANAVRAADATP